jgi:hypothetical protein
MPTKEQNDLAHEVIALLRLATQSDLDRAKRLMRDWPEEMDTLKAGLYETIHRIENDTFLGRLA